MFEAAAAVMAHAFELLSPGWCERELARDAAGRPVDPHAEAATAFSLEGAINRAWVEAGRPGGNRFTCHWNLGTAMDRLYPEFKDRAEAAGLLDSVAWLALNDAYGQEGALRVLRLAELQLKAAASRS